MLPRGQKPPVYCLLSSRQQVPDPIAQRDDGRFFPCYSWTKHAQTPTPQNPSIPRTAWILLLLRPPDVADLTR